MTSSITRRLGRVALVLLALGHLAVPIYLWDGGMIEIEATHFARQYLDARTPLQKVFDPHANDIGTYQARELSYFFDYLDAQVLTRVLQTTPRFFVPFSALLAAFLTVVVFAVGAAVVTPRLSPLTGTLVLLLYLTNHVYLVTTALYYRSAKPLLAPVVLATLFWVTFLLARRPAGDLENRPIRGEFGVTFALGSAMSLLDRQGFFYALTMLAVFALAARRRGGRRDALNGATAAVLLMVVYNLVLGPVIVNYINGYWPSFDYQQLPVVHLVTHPRHLVQAVRLMAQSTRLLVGAFPLWLYVGAAFVLGLWTVRRAGARRDLAPAEAVRSILRSRLGSPVVLLVSLVALSQVLMFALMIIRHPPIWDFLDHRVWYYPLPFQVLVVFGVLLVVDAGLRRWRGISQVAVNAALVVMVVGNVLSWPAYRQVMLTSRWFPEVYEQSALLKASLEEGRPSAALSADYRAFYDHCVATAQSLPESARPRAFRSKPRVHLASDDLGPFLPEFPAPLQLDREVPGPGAR